MMRAGTLGRTFDGIRGAHERKRKTAPRIRMNVPSSPRDLLVPAATKKTNDLPLVGLVVGKGGFRKVIKVWTRFLLPLLLTVCPNLT